MNGVQNALQNNALINIETRLSDLLQQCHLNSFVSVDTIKKWMGDLNDEDPMTLIKMLTGLMDKENLPDRDLFDNLIDTMVTLSHHVPSKKFNGKTFSDELKRREKHKEPTSVYLTETMLPQMEWVDHYSQAMFHMRKQHFFKASKEFDKTFEKLLETKTTSNNIYRIFCNSGISYLCSGNPVLGVQCIEVAHALNPQYTFASEQLQKYERGDLDDIIKLGMLTKIKENFEQWDKKFPRLNVDVVMKWSEKKILKKLSSFGITVNKQEFVNVARTVNHPETLAKKLFYSQEKEERDDDDFIWMAAYALWNIYCPSELSITDFNDVLHEAFLFIKKTNGKNKRKKVTQEAFEKTCAEYFTRLQKYIFSDKKDFLKEWHYKMEIEMDPSYELNTFLTTLLANPSLGNDVLAVVHHLKTQIPHPTWTSTEIIYNIIHNNSRSDDLYKELKQNHPFYCYVACDIAYYYMEQGEYEHAESYLTDALEIIDSRVEKKKFSIDETGTTIYDDYTYVITLLEEVFKKSDADRKKIKVLRAKKQAVENKKEIYSKSPKIEKMDTTMNELINKMERDHAEKSSPIQYYNYLKKFDINFKTKELITAKQINFNVHPGSYHGTKDFEGKKHPSQRQPTKIGRNDPCYCGSGKKYKKCCLERDRKQNR